MKLRCGFRFARSLLLLFPCAIAFFLLLVTSLPAHGNQVILTYTYDKKSQLTAVHFNDDNVIEYSYDAAGNQTSIASTFRPPSIGDCNNDGAVDLKDVILSLQVLSGSATGPIDLRADVDSDAKIGLAEAIHALQFMSK